MNATTLYIMQMIITCTCHQHFLNPLLSSDTSRPPQPSEVDQKVYHFVSKQCMEKDIQNNKFVEHGFFSGHYYGTSINSIRSVVNARKTCILVLIPQVSPVLCDVYMYIHVQCNSKLTCCSVFSPLLIPFNVFLLHTISFCNLQSPSISFPSPLSLLRLFLQGH